MTLVQGTHHITMCVGETQEDYEFHVGLLGLRNVKKTVILDGETPIYHLYYGNAVGEPSTILTAFPMRQAGIKGRKGTNQISSVDLSVPRESLGWWAERLAEHNVEHHGTERFGESRIAFQHPCGIDYALVGVDADEREPWGEGAVPAAHAVRGAHGVTIAVRDLDEMASYLVDALDGRHLASEGIQHRYEIGDSGGGKVIDLVEDPERPAGTWRFAEGVIHHIALDVVDFDRQAELKAHIEGLGYTDVSERKDRNYFESVYTRSPAGALFELAVSAPQGFARDESVDALGSEVKVPEFLEDKRERFLAQLEPLTV